DRGRRQHKHVRLGAARGRGRGAPGGGRRPAVGGGGGPAVRSSGGPGVRGGRGPAVECSSIVSADQRDRTRRRGDPLPTADTFQPQRLTRIHPETVLL